MTELGQKGVQVKRWGVDCVHRGGSRRHLIRELRGEEVGKGGNQPQSF